MTGMRSLFVLAMLGAQGAVAADNEPPHDTPALRQRAEDLAGAASQRFSDILDNQHQQQLAQSVAPPAATQPAAEAGGAFAPVWNWLARAAQSYDDVVISQLKNGDGWTVIVQRAGETSPSPAPAAPAAEPQAPELRGWSGLVEVMRDWLARANRSYRTEIVTPLRDEAGAAPAPPAASDDQIKRDAVAEAEARRRSLEAKRAAEDDEAKRLAAPQVPTPTQTPTQAPTPTQTQPNREAAAAEAARVAEEEKSNRRLQEQAAIAQRRADEEERRAAVAEAERRAKAESRARIIEEAAEARRKADAEEKRLADEAEAKRKDEAKRNDEEKRLADEAAAKRKDEDARRQAAEADAAERKAVAEAEAEAKRKAEIDAEATRRSEAAARAKQQARDELANAPTAPAPDAVPSPPVEPRPNAAAAPPLPVAKENSTVAAPSAPAGPDQPAAPAPSRDAAPTTRQETVTAEASPPPVARNRSVKRSYAKSGAGRKQPYAHRHKKRHAYKQRRPRRAYAHGRSHRWQAVEVVYVKRRCACRCGSVVAKPRRRHRVDWHGYARPLHVQRRYRVHKHKRHHGRLTYHHRRHYIH